MSELSSHTNDTHDGSSSSNNNILPSPDILRHIVDVHCHPTDSWPVRTDAMQDLGITICAMSSMASDQSKVKELASSYPEKVVPCFGYHPWFSYYISTSASPPSKEEHYRNLLLSDTSRSKDKDNVSAKITDDDDRENEFLSLLATLPEPRPLSSVLTELRENFSLFPHAMLGEVGLDRIFRVPEDYFASPRVLTPFTIPIEHQVQILEAQIELAIELGRNVSIHSVKSQQQTVDLLARLKTKHGAQFNKISIDMHSCGLNPQKKHENVFLSLSTVINHKHANHRALIAACSPNRILAESDYNTVDMCTTQTWDMIKIIAEVKGWPVETEWVENEDDLKEEERGVVRRLEKNWLRFKNGNHPFKEKKNRRIRKQHDYHSEESDIETK
ncbi:TatD DNase family Scn1 [Agrocybe pediades]|nr:TatD DNase family Scn1 [Agrocybe pediades]